MLRALIFDVDGTIADTERDGHRVAFNRAFADAGLDWHWDVARYGALLRVTGGRERILHFIDTDAAHIATNEREALARRLHARKTERNGLGMQRLEIRKPGGKGRGARHRRDAAQGNRRKRRRIDPCLKG